MVTRCHLVVNMTSYLWFVSAFCLCEWLDCLSWGVCNVVSFLCISCALFCRYKCQLYTQEGGNKTSDVYVYLIFCCKVWFLAQWCWDYCSEETNAFISDDLSPYWSHTHTCLTAFCPGFPGWAGTRKVKPIWLLLKQETVSGSGISWVVCKLAPGSIQITTPAPHH